jgi:hypothetical protein
MAIAPNPGCPAARYKTRSSEPGHCVVVAEPAGPPARWTVIEPHPFSASGRGRHIACVYKVMSGYSPQRARELTHCSSSVDLPTRVFATPLCWKTDSDSEQSTAHTIYVSQLPVNNERLRAETVGTETAEHPTGMTIRIESSPLFIYSLRNTVDAGTFSGRVTRSVT